MEFTKYTSDLTLCISEETNFKTSSCFGDIVHIAVLHWFKYYSTNTNEVGIVHSNQNPIYKKTNCVVGMSNSKCS